MNKKDYPKEHAAGTIELEMPKDQPATRRYTLAHRGISIKMCRVFKQSPKPIEVVVIEPHFVKLGTATLRTRRMVYPVASPEMRRIGKDIRTPQ